MKQKDYKAIAKIIRNICEGFKNKESEIFFKILLAKKLADYFEEEELKEIARKQYSGKGSMYSLPKFNRKQFLKDCGVTE